jgi:phage tail-like protein
VRKAQIKRLLPSLFQRTTRPGSPLWAILDVMESMQAPSESALDHLDITFDPRRAPDAFVPYLATWVDLEMLLTVSRGPAFSSVASFPTGLGRLRELAANAVALSQWRGTGKGLWRFLETATGKQGFTINEQVIGPDGQPKPFHVQINAPGELLPQRTLIEKIIELEKPAYVTYELLFGTGNRSTGTAA